eukprot:536471-Ditylum_brightwellii.AAC.1
MQEVDVGLEVLQDALLADHFKKNPVFHVPRLLPNYGVSQEYTTRITSNVMYEVKGNEKGYYRPPKGAWSRDPPSQMRRENQKSNQTAKDKNVNDNDDKNNNSNNVNFDKLKKNLD